MPAHRAPYPVIEGWGIRGWGEAFPRPEKLLQQIDEYKCSGGKSVPGVSLASPWAPSVRLDAEK